MATIKADNVQSPSVSSPSIKVDPTTGAVTFPDGVVNLPLGFRTQATANSTLALVVGDAGLQEFTGSTPGQIVQMPDVTTLGPNKGWNSLISNKSTQTIAVNSSGGNLIYTVPAATDWLFTCALITGTTAASWSNSYAGASSAPVSGTTFHGVRCTPNTPQAIPNATFTPLEYQVENYDTDAYLDTVTNNSRITIPAGKAGYYRLTASLFFIGTVNIVTELQFLVNGVTEVSRRLEGLGALGAFSIEHTDTVYLNVGDYVESLIYQANGGSLSTSTGYPNFFSATLLGT